VAGNGRPRNRYSPRERKVHSKIGEIFDVVSIPLLVFFLLNNRRFDEAYGLTWRKKLTLVWRMYRNARVIETGTSFRAHVAMAAKVFETPKSTEGVLIECGCWKGGTTTNLSLIAELAGRKLIAYDSFEGLPPPTEGDRWAHKMATGAFLGSLEVVTEHVRDRGAIEVTEFRKGWFADTLGDHTEPIVLAYVDVDYQQSLHECVLYLWPHLTRRGYYFIDEYLRLDYCALFFSERWWRENFDRPPPGIMGPGTGIAVGQMFLGPHRERPPIQVAKSCAYTRKDFYGMWDYFPDAAPQVRPGGGSGSADSAEGWTATTAPIGERINAKQKRKIAQVLRDRAAAEDRRTRPSTD